MNFKYSFIFLFFIQLAIRYNNAKITVDTICKGGKLIQMSNHYECKCPSGYALKTENICEPIVKCDKLENINKVCGEYSICRNQGNLGLEKSFVCMCTNGYMLSQNICKPTRCYNYECNAGKCILDSINPNNPVCSCDIGKVLQNGKCTGTGETKCLLKCKAAEECKLTGKHYECVSKPQAPGTGSGTPSNSSFMNGMSIISIIALLVIYVIVM
uniref:Ookinete surface antigen-like protein Pfs28 n=1 Tax=Plasmodium berghei TaxID=5821 RepID=Q9GTY8_PLABE|nr:ookinete surface antigen-like protein Pfs28 [Plasmodium berghei]